MGGIFGVASKSSCVLDLFFGIDYHSHLGTRRGGMAVYDPAKGFDRAIHNIDVYKRQMRSSGSGRKSQITFMT